MTSGLKGPPKCTKANGQKLTDLWSSKARPICLGFPFRLDEKVARRGGVRRPLHPAPRNLAGQARESQVRTLWKGLSSVPARGGHLGDEPHFSRRPHCCTPSLLRAAATKLEPGGKKREGKKKPVSLARGQRPSPPRRRRAPARENNCSLLPASSPRAPCFPAAAGEEPGQGEARSGLAARPSFPLAPPLRLHLLWPPRSGLS